MKTCRVIRLGLVVVMLGGTAYLGITGGPRDCGQRVSTVSSQLATVVTFLFAALTFWGAVTHVRAAGTPSTGSPD